MGLMSNIKLKSSPALDKIGRVNKTPATLGKPTVKPALKPVVKPEVVQPVPSDTKLQVPPPQPQQPGPLEPINRPKLEDYIREAQKLGETKVGAAGDILEQKYKGFGEDVARSVYGQNVGATSGVGQQVVGRALEQFGDKLLPYAQQTGAELGQKALEFREEERRFERGTGREDEVYEKGVKREDEVYEKGVKREDELYGREEATRRRDNMFSQILAGTVDKSQMSQDDWAALGITDPQAVNTLAQLDVNNAMIAQGLDPNNPQDQQAYKEELKNAAVTQLRNQVMANYAAVNDGRMPTTAEQEMMMIIFGGDTGAMSIEEQDAIIAKYNEDQWERTMKKAEAMNPPEGKVLCTELHRQGLLSDKIYASDKLVGEYYSKHDTNIVIGYHSWAKPLVKLMERSRVITMILKPFITAWAIEMHHIVTKEGRGSLLGRIMQAIGIPICKYIGKKKGAVRWQLV